MQTLLTVREFAAATKSCTEKARQFCHSKLARDHKIARKHGERWLICWEKYMEIVWGGGKDETAGCGKTSTRRA